MFTAPALLPYQYPVAALLVDDDPALLSGLSAGLSRERKVFSAASGERALDCYRRAAAPRPSFLRRSRDQTGLTEHRVVVDVTGIASLMDHEERHAEIGLLVVDYKMPGLNGVELCESLRHEPCRRILLTGVADERVAVKAFNSGLIHQYVRKDHDTLDRLGALMRREQLQYFRAVSQTLSEGLRDRLGAFEQVPAVCDALLTLIAQYDVVEYYLATEPNGLLTRDRAGKRRRVLVQSEPERRSALEILGASGHEAGFEGAMVYADAPPGSPPRARTLRPLMGVASPQGMYLIAVEDC